MDGYQQRKRGVKNKGQIGDIKNYAQYIDALLLVWKECQRVLKPNGKLVVNTPLMPMQKKELCTHHNRHIFNINSDIEHSILKNTSLFLLDLYIWNRTNSTKKLMFGSYPYPRNFYAQNIVEFISVYVKNGTPDNNIQHSQKVQSALTKEEWLEFTKQIWNIPIPNKKDSAFGEHSAIMPNEIAYRCIRMFSFVGDVVLDPFAGSGTTLKVAQDCDRYFVGYEISKTYEKVISQKTVSTKLSPAKIT